MSITLRVVLLIGAICTVIWILRKIYKCKVNLQDAIFWLCLAILLAILGVVPQIAYFLTDLIGIQAPVNFIFLSVIALLMMKLFTLSIKVSMLETKIIDLVSEVSVIKKEIKNKGEWNESAE